MFTSLEWLLVKLLTSLLAFGCVERSIFDRLLNNSLKAPHDLISSVSRDVSSSIQDS